jgi:hypothetical protein
MLKISEKVQKYYDEVIAFAKSIGLYDNDANVSLKWCLDYLANYGGNDENGEDRCVVELYKDFAPYSFEFTIYRRGSNGQPDVVWFNGGLIFHGDHDGHGSGSAPTLAVTLTPTDGWSIHT